MSKKKLKTEEVIIWKKLVEVEPLEVKPVEAKVAEQDTSKKINYVDYTVEVSRSEVAIFQKGWTSQSLVLIRMTLNIDEVKYFCVNSSYISTL